MLCTAAHLRELSFEHLMEVYREGNRINGRILAPFDSQERQLRLAEQDFYSYLLEQFFPTPGARYAVWTAGGKYVSALRLEPYRDGLLLEALETAPGERKKGYASALICAVQEMPEHRGVRLYSHVDKQNAASLRVHLGCGFQILSDCAAYVDGTVSSRAYTLLYVCGQGANTEGDCSVCVRKP